MSALSVGLASVLLAWLLTLFFVILWKLLNGGINTRGLLVDHHGKLSPERVQLLLATVLGGSAFVHSALTQVDFAPDAAHRLPDAPAELLAALAGSNGLYLAAKQFRFLIR